MRRNQDKTRLRLFIGIIIAALAISVACGIMFVPDDFTVLAICGGTVVLSFIGIGAFSKIAGPKRGGR